MDTCNPAMLNETKKNSVSDHTGVNTMQTLSAAKVLVVEDNLISIHVTTFLLKQCGICNITIAKSGKEALVFFSTDFDLVLLDIGLPDMSGIEVCKQMRDKLQGKPLPIIAYTTETSNEQACRAVGVDDFLMKPSTANQIQVMIQRFLG